MEASAAAPSALPAVVLVRGCPRSGTTMAARLIGSGPRSGMFWEYSLGALVRDLEPIFAYSRIAGAEQANSVRARDVSVEEFGPVYVRRTGLGGVVLPYPRTDRLAHIVTAVVAASLEKDALHLIGSKTPGPSADSDYALLSPHFPAIKFVYMVREPLATINSIINRRNLGRLGFDSWSYASVDVAIDEYRAAICSLISHVAQHRDRCFVLKYEDAVERPEATAQAIERFLGVSVGAGAVELQRSRTYATDQARRTVLTADEEAAVRRAFGAAIDDWRRKRLTGNDLGDRVDALRDCLDVVETDREYRYDDPAGPRTFLGLGWSAIQRDGLWIDGNRADLVFRAPAAGRYVLSLDGYAFVPKPGASVSLRVEADGRDVLRHTYSHDPSQPSEGLFSAAPAPLVSTPFELRSDVVHRLALQVDGGTRPLDVGLSADARNLGFLMRTLRLTAVP